MKQKIKTGVGHSSNGDRQIEIILLPVPPTERKKPRGKQHLAWQQRMRKHTTDLSKRAVSFFRGWSLKDPPTSWLETVEDMTKNYG